MQKPVLLLACLAACCLQWSCTATAPVAPGTELAAKTIDQPADDLAADYAPLRSAPGRVMRLQPQDSQVRILVFRAGRSAGLGHNHVLSAPAFDGFFYWPGAGQGGARFDLVFRLDQLAFDLAAQRAELGPAFAAPLSDAAIAATRAHMLGPQNMQAERYPLVRIHSLAISGEAPKFSARLSIEIHGQRRELLVPLAVTGLPQRVQASGAFVVRQSDFGVQAYSVLGGLLAVQDEVRVEFNLVGE